MNPFQSGTLSRQLVPQSFTNSRQTGNLQTGSSGSNLQQSSSLLLKEQSSNTKLRVVVNGPSSGVLADNTVAAPASGSGALLWVPMFLIVVSAALGVYFFRRYHGMVRSEEVLEGESENTQ